ncbi:hypothetical protein [Halomarina litorea]|uniref:hypothetical protein n=1 Tax=Halomarina litorea TaxID=2961595 RepID=UPI0020C289FC|nr:hypothetical protein [Halomarina sp. BCD28]
MGLSRRHYLTAVGSAAVLLPVSVGASGIPAGGVTGQVVQSDSRFLEYERDENDDITFVDPRTGTRFETRGDDLDFDDVGVRCRERPDRLRGDFTRRNLPGLPDTVRFQRRDPRFRFRTDIGGERVDNDFDGLRHDFSVEGGSTQVEDEGQGERDSIQYRGRTFTLDLRRDRRIRVRGALRFDFNGRDDVDFRDGEVRFRSDARRFRCRSRLLDLEFDRRTRDFDARRVT